MIRNGLDFSGQTALCLQEPWSLAQGLFDALMCLMSLRRCRSFRPRQPYPRIQLKKSGNFSNV